VPMPVRSAIMRVHITKLTKPIKLAKLRTFENLCLCACEARSCVTLVVLDVLVRLLRICAYTRAKRDEEEDTCMSYEEEDTCMSYEEEDTCLYACEAR